ncbi:hypothetical protein PUNSTDRAFT_56122 [Punctularia strigosozonata HHB-11173 SS5]|uniref:Uncharacterized protein n=1 Tax=Punctularia strigosozonata (strain HHB-11173) TaxID=741275 RepID=R7S0B2_PUNST|nr:uncharacterized protein PUNSTDRAFT_56122 [Punctularia strigosozonata HHB-11173 SS5]EIN03678.1 hypothetical protein PUNSTDRAFT_56122 [Punctularia strigosozonata HHB-11173 SS5]
MRMCQSTSSQRRCGTSVLRGSDVQRCASDFAPLRGLSRNGNYLAAAHPRSVHEVRRRDHRPGIERARWSRTAR